MGDAGAWKKSCYQPVVGARPWRAVALFAALLAWLAAGLAPAAAEKRIALVIANAAYPTAPLANPVRDARRISAALTSVGFTVEQAYDLSQVEMRQQLSLFAARLSGPDTVALFYYAGHAVQLDGVNILLPVDSTFKSEADVRLSGVRLDQILFAMRPVKSRLSIAIVDACRDNPFPALARSLKRGLAPVNAPAGTLVAFSTAPGSVALDGAGRLSPYAKGLAEALDAPGLTIEDVFKHTRVSVMQETDGQQVPWEHSSLVGRFVFRPAAPGGTGAILDGWTPRPAIPLAKPVADARTLYRQFLIYEEGRGVPHDPAKAAARLLAAYKAGDRDAERLLLTTYRRLRMSTRRAIQRELAEAGHYRDVADGIFGRNTRRALEAYRG